MVALLSMRDGPVIREDAILLGLRLEAEGYTLSTKDGGLTVTPGSRLSAADRQAIGACKQHLLAFLAYGQEGHAPR